MSEIVEAKLTPRQHYWLEHLRACEASGKTMRAYAAENGIGARSLYDAKKRLVKGGVLNVGAQRQCGSGFVRAQIAGTKDGGDCRIQFPNGIAVMLSQSLDDVSLSRLLGTLATLG